MAWLVKARKNDTDLLFMQLVLPYQHRCFTFSDNVSNVKLNQLMEELAEIWSHMSREGFHSTGLNGDITL